MQKGRIPEKKGGRGHEKSGPERYSVFLSHHQRDIHPFGNHCVKLIVIFHAFDGFLVIFECQKKRIKLIVKIDADESYCGNGDQWFFPAYALRDTVIEVNDRICQFRIFEHQPAIEFEETEDLGNEDRGGIGSTGKQ